MGCNLGKDSISIFIHTEFGNFQPVTQAYFVCMYCMYVAENCTYSLGLCTNTAAKETSTVLLWIMYKITQSKKKKDNCHVGSLTFCKQF